MVVKYVIIFNAVYDRGNETDFALSINLFVSMFTVTLFYFNRNVYVNFVEVSSSLLKCDACGSQQETTAISQCCNDHLVCKTCVEKQVKSVISLDSQDVRFSQISSCCL